MDGLTESYENVLKYLETQNKKFKKPVTKKTIEVKKKEETIIEKKQEEPKIEDYLIIKPPLNKSKSQSIEKSKGFSVKQFELLMRSKLIEEYKIQQSYERPYIAVGELGNCMRQNYYSRMKYQVDIAELFKFSYLFLITEVGKKVHGIFQELYNFTEIEKSVVSEKYKVKGRADAIKDNNLFEIKTFDDKGEDKRKYEEKDFLQANVYTYILNNEYDYKIDNVTIIYVPRELKKIFPFDLKPDNDKAKEFLERGQVLLNHLNNHKVPDPIGATTTHCKYCLYKEYCRKDEFSKIKPPFIVGKEKPKEKEDKAVFLL